VGDKLLGNFLGVRVLSNFFNRSLLTVKFGAERGERESRKRERESERARARARESRLLFLRSQVVVVHS